MNPALRRCGDDDFRLRRCADGDFRLRACPVCQYCAGGVPPPEVVIVTSGIQLCLICRGHVWPTSFRHEVLWGECNGTFVATLSPSNPCRWLSDPVIAIRQYLYPQMNCQGTPTITDREFRFIVQFGYVGPPNPYWYIEAYLYGYQGGQETGPSLFYGRHEYHLGPPPCSGPWPVFVNQQNGSFRCEPGLPLFYLGYGGQMTVTPP